MARLADAKRRTGRAVSLVAVFAVVLVGFPIAYALFAGGARGVWFAAAYVTLGALAVAAAFFLASSRRGRLNSP